MGERQNWVKAGSQPWHWGEGQHTNSYLEGAAKHLPGVRHRAFLADGPQGHPLPKMNEDIGIQSDQATGVGCGP